MDQKTTERWNRMHAFHRILYAIRRKDEKLTRAESRRLAHAEYEQTYGRRYRRPGIEFKW